MQVEQTINQQFWLLLNFAQKSIFFSHEKFRRESNSRVKIKKKKKMWNVQRSKRIDFNSLYCFIITQQFYTAQYHNF